MRCATDLLHEDRGANTGETQKVGASEHADGDHVMKIKQMEIFAPQLDAHDEELMDPERCLQITVAKSRMS